MRISILGLGMVVALGIAACSGSSGAEVLYRAGGSADQAEITYIIDGAEIVETITLPFERATSVSGSFSVEMTVVNGGEEGDVTCLIEIAGFQPVSATGEALATCTGSGSIGGSSANVALAGDFADREVSEEVVETVAEVAPTSITHDDPLGRFSLEYPGTWQVAATGTIPGIYITRIDAEPPGYRPDPELLVTLLLLEPSSGGEPNVILLTDPAVFTGPADLDRWLALHLESIEAVDVSSEAITMNHGPGVRYSATVDGKTRLGVATRSGPRYYAAETLGNEDPAASEGAVILESLRFFPEAETEPGPLAEARNLAISLDQGGVPALDASASLPATWAIDEIIQLDSGAIVAGMHDPTVPSSQFRVIIEALPDPDAVPLEGYADFYLDQAISNGGTIESRDTGVVDEQPAVVSVWSNQGKMIYDTYVIVDGFGLRIQMEFADIDDDPDLAGTVRLLTIQFTDR